MAQMHISHVSNEFALLMCLASILRMVSMPPLSHICFWMRLSASDIFQRVPKPEMHISQSSMCCLSVSSTAWMIFSDFFLIFLWAIIHGSLISA